MLAFDYQGKLISQSKRITGILFLERGIKKPGIENYENVNTRGWSGKCREHTRLEGTHETFKSL